MTHSSYDSLTLQHRDDRYLSSMLCCNLIKKLQYEGTSVAFHTILGQEHALALLQKALVSARLGHAYLFYGPRGIGKKLTALQFAKALVCQDATAEACDRCASCHKMTTGNHPDVVVINPEGTSIRIEK